MIRVNYVLYSYKEKYVRNFTILHLRKTYRIINFQRSTPRSETISGNWNPLKMMKNIL